ncbi:MAG TPA: Holliday junction resolvase RuvX [Euzebyales bacterium]|nr:Holliday junction resolvase RuvX [Euzebyales bacterium]
MRALGVDLGTVRIGLALTDPSRSIASPYDTLPAGDVAADDWPRRIAATIAGVAAEVGADAIVIGLPRAMSGKDTAGAAGARRVADALRTATDASVHLWDERLSSVEAERMLIGAGRRRQQRRTARDRVAAAIILQSWLQANAPA